MGAPEQTFYAYLHCKPDGTPFYVGKGTGRRATDLSHRTTMHKRIARKYGVDVFIFKCDDEKHAFAREKAWIAQLRRDGFTLCNFTDGGEGTSGRDMSAETRRRISEAKTGVRIARRSDAHRKQISERMRGKKNSLGTKFSEESRLRCSLAQIGNRKNVGRKQPKEEVEKRVAANKLIIEEVAEKISKALKGRPSPLRGRVMPEEHRKKIAEANKGKVFSEETRAKMSAAQARRAARERAEREQLRGE